MNLSELQFINHHKLPVKIMLLNNGGYHAISSMQVPLPHLRSDLTTAGLATSFRRALSSQ